MNPADIKKFSNELKRERAFLFFRFYLMFFERVKESKKGCAKSIELCR